MYQSRHTDLTRTLGLSIGFAALIIMLIMLSVMLPYRIQAQTSVVSVDLAGQCNGNQPCYTSIQTGVNNTAPGGTISIFPGVYTETVDLSLMSSALIAPTLGNITLNTVNAQGTVISGTATVSPVTGIALATSSVFTGNVALTGLKVTSPDNHGMSLDVNGDVSLTNVQATNAFTKGIDIDLTSPNTARSLTISNTTVTGSGDKGFDLDVISGTITLAKITATMNGDDGVGADMITGTFSATNIVVVKNGQDGLDAEIITGTITVDTLNSTANSDDGLSLGIGDDKKSIGSGTITVSNATVNNNTDDGVRLRGYGGTVVSKMRDLTAKNNGNANFGRGFSIETNGDVSITNATSQRNERENYKIEITNGGNLTLNNVLSDGGNVEEGMELRLEGGGSATFNDVATTNNDREGMQLEIAGGGSAIMNNITATGNTQEGIKAQIFGGGSITITKALSNQNLQNGFDIVLTDNGNITISDTEARANGDPSAQTPDDRLRDGFSLETVEGDIRIRNTSAVSNTASGFGLVSSGSVLFTNVTIQNNGSDGVSLVQAPFRSPVDNLGITNSIITGNNADSTANGVGGIRLSELDPNGTLAVSGNIIADNSNAGLVLTKVPTQTILQAVGNWWGDVSGPSGKGSGSGASVVANAGSIVFTPWIDTIDFISAPSQSPQVTNLRFQFRDAAGTVFLGTGPGNPNNTTPPFRLSSDRGTIQTSGLIEGDSGVMTAILTQPSSGNATVTLNGLGKLDATCRTGGTCTFGTNPSSLFLYIPMIKR
ncbi:MAG: right-handed parallel beta-helix repeat-containing protein [Chloroflexales bacterium]|nr:right-handed parallel beta-helix repeat-containing protein [Chloroflexales bacterium]